MTAILPLLPACVASWSSGGLVARETVMMMMFMGWCWNLVNHRWWVGNDAGDVHGVGNSWHLKMSFNGFAPFVLAGRSSHGVEEGLPWMTAIFRLPRITSTPALSGHLDPRIICNDVTTSFPRSSRIISTTWSHICTGSAEIQHTPKVHCMMTWHHHHHHKYCKCSRGIYNFHHLVNMAAYWAEELLPNHLTIWNIIIVFF